MEKCVDLYICGFITTGFVSSYVRIISSLFIRMDSHKMGAPQTHLAKAVDVIDA